MNRLALFALLVSVVGCAVNPATGQRQLMLVSEGQEIGMGQQADPDIVAAYGLYPDSAIQVYVRGIGERLAAQSERPNLPWTFRVLDDPVVNAFALPGGFNYVTRGILVYFNSEAEMVAVMGHELGHVTARHGAQQMTQQQIAQVGLAAGMILVPRLQDFAGLAQAGLGLMFLSFSRGDETQADELGLRYMYRLGYDPREMPKVFATLESVSRAEGGDRLPQWLSTHPNPENRQQHIHQMIAQWPQDFSGRLIRHDEYIRRLDGMTYGANPREGFFREGLYLHPDLRFQVQFPTGWQTSNQKSAVLAQSPQQDALMQLTAVREATPAAALQTFLSQEGVTSGGIASTTVNGLPAALARFQATTQQATLAGLVTAIQYNGSVYRLLSYSAQASWPNFEAAARAWMQSFRPLTDPEALAVQPLRIQVVRADRPMTLGEFQQRYPSKVDLATVARVNQLATGASLTAGQLVKRVVGGPLP
jgi:predicted Zn-dependent protease